MRAEQEVIGQQFLLAEQTAGELSLEGLSLKCHLSLVLLRVTTMLSAYEAHPFSQGRPHTFDMLGHG